jgi:hypothetical protein
MKRCLLLVITGLCIGDCKKDELIVVNQFLLPMPSLTPSIDRSVLTSGATFGVGYANGNIRSTRVTLTWQRSGDANFLAYRIVRGSLLVRTVTDAQVNSATDTNLFQNSYYKYTVAVLTQHGTHRYDSITVKTPRFQSPTLSSQVFADTSVRLTWTRSAESATAYRLERAPSSGSFQVLSSPTDTFYVDRSVVYGGQYFYRVAASSPYETTATSAQSSASVTFLVNEVYESGVIPSGWTTGGNLSWSISNVNPYQGTYSARSGPITHSQSSFIQRVVSFSGTRTISFRYRVSSEQTNDFLRFAVNGVVSGQDQSGDTGWQLYTTTYSGAGSVTLRWEYIKNASVSTGQDAAWLDNVIVQ